MFCHVSSRLVFPDVVLVPNHGGNFYVDPYIVSSEKNLIDFSDFENRFHPLFVDELMFEEKQKVNGADKIVRGLRGIPVWFEPLGMYYNRNVMPTAPTFGKILVIYSPDDAKKIKFLLFLSDMVVLRLIGDILPLLTIQYKGHKFQFIQNYRQCRISLNHW